MRNSRIGLAAANISGYFALVMATGIISIATQLLGHDGDCWALLVINLVAYSVLGLLLFIRVLGFFPRVLADLGDHVRGPGFFTVVAGTCVLGSQFLIVASWQNAAGILWLVGLLLWTVIMYSFFASVTVRENKPPLESGLSGSWLILPVVATQSISVLGTMLASRFGTYRESLLFFTLCMFLLGCMHYLLLITLIFYRFTFVNLSTAALTPPYWINMGSVAITTLAGARLMLAAPECDFLGEILPFLKGFTLFFWAAGTWWILCCSYLDSGGTSINVSRLSTIRNIGEWSFLLVCTGLHFPTIEAINFEPLLIIPRFFVFIALAAWLIAFVGLIHNLVPWKAKPLPVVSNV